MSARYWPIPFGTTGDKTPIPNTLQPDGAVSAPIGWGPNYEKEKTEAGYLPVSRKYTNQLAFDITSGLKDLQDFGAPAYYPAAAPYAINAQVRHLDKVWRSTIIANNSVPGENIDWVDISAPVGQATELVTGVVKIATASQVAALTNDTSAVTPLKLAPIYSRVANLETGQTISKPFTSNHQIISAGGAISVTHNLGKDPVIWDSFIVCLDPEHGYAVGDILKLASSAPDNAYALGVSVIPSSTSFRCRFGSQAGVFFVLNFSTGSTAIITPSKWRYFIKAFA